VFQGADEGLDKDTWKEWLAREH